jgi:hypothetical protein
MLINYKFKLLIVAKAVPTSNIYEQDLQSPPPTSNTEN